MTIHVVHIEVDGGAIVGDFDVTKWWDSTMVGARSHFEACGHVHHTVFFACSKAPGETFLGWVNVDKVFARYQSEGMTPALARSLVGSYCRTHSAVATVSVMEAMHVKTSTKKGCLSSVVESDRYLVCYCESLIGSVAMEYPVTDADGRVVVGDPRQVEIAPDDTFWPLIGQNAHEQECS